MSDPVAINADRGEVGITLDGRVFPMLPTFAANNSIESQLGAVSTLVARMLREDLPTIHQLAIVATECIKAAGRDRNDPMLAGVGAQTIGEMIFDEGMTDELVKSFIQVLSNMVSGGTNSTRKKAAAAAAAAKATSESPTGS